jgi:hypothetical protein
MKRNKHLPIPQWEFGFAPSTFNLMVETGLDGDRIARERAEADLARSRSDAAQAAFFNHKSKNDLSKHTFPDTGTDTERVLAG